MSKVYFTKEISSESLVRIFEKVGVKISTGEDGSKSYLKP